MTTFERGCMPRSAPVHVAVPRSPQQRPAVAAKAPPPPPAATAAARRSSSGSASTHHSHASGSSGFSGSRTAERAALRQAARTGGVPRADTAVSLAGLTESASRSSSAAVSGAGMSSVGERDGSASGAATPVESVSETPMEAVPPQEQEQEQLQQTPTYPPLPPMSLAELAEHPCGDVLPPLPPAGLLSSTGFDAASCSDAAASDAAPPPVTTVYYTSSNVPSDAASVGVGSGAPAAAPVVVDASPPPEYQREMREAVETLEALREANNELHCTLEEATKAIAILRAENEAERARAAQLQGQLGDAMDELARERNGSHHLAEIAQLRQALDHERDLVRQKTLEVEKAEADVVVLRATVQQQQQQRQELPYSMREEELLLAADRQIELCNELFAP